MLAPVRSIVDLLGVALPDDPISEERFVRQVLLDPNFREEGLALESCGGALAGICLALTRRVPLENAALDQDKGFITLLGVHPQFRGIGIGTKLLGRAEEFLGQSGCKTVSLSPYAPGYFLPGLDVDRHAPALAFLLARGYHEVYRPIAMEASLWNLATPDWVATRENEHKQLGLGYEPYSPDLTLPLLRVTETWFSGDWVRVVRETMGRIALGEPARRLYAAVQRDGDAVQVLGFSHFEGERFGPIGVADAQRGRGIGQILMYKTLQAQQRAGYRTSWFLWSDDRTAERLYSAAGFREVRRFAILRREF